MSDFHSIAARWLAGRAPPPPPPDWLVAPHLRRGAAVPPHEAVLRRPRPSQPNQPTSRRRLPFPEWRDAGGVPLAALLGPPGWRTAASGQARS